MWHILTACHHPIVLLHDHAVGQLVAAELKAHVWLLQHIHVLPDAMHLMHLSTTATSVAGIHIYTESNVAKIFPVVWNL